MAYFAISIFLSAFLLFQIQPLVCVRQLAGQHEPPQGNYPFGLAWGFDLPRIVAWIDLEITYHT
jgi:hypothetical protein